MEKDFKKGSKYARPRVWIIAVLLCIVLNIFIYTLFVIVLDVRVKPYEKRNLDTIRDLKEHIKSNPNEKHVVLIGSSVIQHGLWCSAKFDEIQSNTDAKINIYKIFEAGIQLEYFVKELHLFDSIGKFHPDLVLIEDHLLLTKNTHRFEENFVTGLYFNYAHTLRNGKRLLFNSDLNMCISPNYFNKMDSLKIAFSFQELSRKEDNLYFEYYLKHNSNESIALGLIESPRPRIYKEGFERTKGFLEAEKLRKYYLDKNNLFYLPFDQEFHWSDFLDEGHMNKKGQKKYSIWLLNTLEKHFSD